MISLMSLVIVVENTDSIKREYLEDIKEILANQYYLLEIVQYGNL